MFYSNIKRYTLVLGIIISTVMANAQSICVPQLSYGVNPFACDNPVSSWITVQEVTGVLGCTVLNAGILDANGAQSNMNSIASFVTECGESVGSDFLYSPPSGGFGNGPILRMKASGQTGWVDVKVTYNCIGNNSERFYHYFFFNPDTYTGLNPTSFSTASGNSLCPGAYTAFRIQRTNLPIYSYKLTLQEVNSSNQLVAGGLNWDSGLKYTSSTNPGVNLEIIPQNEGFTCTAGKRYKLTLTNTSPCGTTYSSNTYYTISSCTPNASLTPSGVDISDNGTTISSFCSATPSFPIALSNTMPNGAPAVTEVKLYLQQVTDAIGTGVIGGETQSTPQSLASSYDLKNATMFSLFQSTLALGNAQVKYFKIRAELKNALGTTTTSPKYFRISNNQLVSPTFDFKVLSGSILDVGSLATDGLIETNVPPQSSRGYELGSVTCGILPHVTNYTHYRVQISRTTTDGLSKKVAIYDSGIQPAPVYSYDFNGRLIEGTNSYFSSLSTTDRNRYNFSCTFSALNECGWVTYAKSFFITTSTSCPACRPVDAPFIDGQSNNTKADFENTDAVQFNLNPNPTDGLMFFDLSGTLPNTESLLQIINLQGEILFSQSIASDINTGQIDLSALPVGLYFYRLQHGTNLISGKFIRS